MRARGAYSVAGSVGRQAVCAAQRQPARAQRDAIALLARCAAVRRHRASITAFAAGLGAGVVDAFAAAAVVALFTDNLAADAVAQGCTMFGGCTRLARFAARRDVTVRNASCVTDMVTAIARDAADSIFTGGSTVLGYGALHTAIRAGVAGAIGAARELDLIAEVQDPVQKARARLL